MVEVKDGPPHCRSTMWVKAQTSFEDSVLIIDKEKD